MTGRGGRPGFIIAGNENQTLHPLQPAAWAGFSSGAILAGDFAATTAPVGRNGETPITPANPMVTPAGVQLELPGMRPQALALSPDGKLLITAGITHELVAASAGSDRLSVFDTGSPLRMTRFVTFGGVLGAPEFLTGAVPAGGTWG
jgi:hypothetical protein